MIWVIYNATILPLSSFLPSSFQALSLLLILALVHLPPSRFLPTHLLPTTPSFPVYSPVPSHPRSNTFPLGPLPLLPSLQPVKEPESQDREFTALGEAYFECCKIRTGDLSNMPETDIPPLLAKNDLDPPLPSTRHAMHMESRGAVSSRGGSHLAGPNKNIGSLSR